MAYCLSTSEPSPVPMLTYCQLDSRKYTLMKNQTILLKKIYLKRRPSSAILPPNCSWGNVLINIQVWPILRENQSSPVSKSLWWRHERYVLSTLMFSLLRHRNAVEQTIELPVIWYVIKLTTCRPIVSIHIHIYDVKYILYAVPVHFWIGYRPFPDPDMTQFAHVSKRW